mgnify:CR=1 FL=1
MKIYSPLLLTLLFTFTSIAVAQDTKAKIEIGVQATSLTLFNPDFEFDNTQGGIGGRFTYNINRSIAADAEFNFFPQKQFFVINSDGRAIQGQFGVKAGKRWDKAGLFAKVRPGFLSLDRFASFVAGPNNIATFTIERKNLFSLDTGGVFELYPSRRIVVRFEAGDTIIRHPAQLGPVSIVDFTVEEKRPAKFKHNFQYTFGVGFRLGDYPDKETTTDTSSDVQGRTRRFEAGVQVTSLFVNPPSVNFISFGPGIHAEPGFGGRFTFNLTDNIGLEAEGNYFTRRAGPFDGGHMFQGQFGAKLGKRFDRWGVFGKARPGFVGFTEVIAFPFGAQVPGVIPSDTKLYPSLDLGGVVEFYISPRWMARIDVGDTIIRYGALNGFGFAIRDQQTEHALQLSSGIGFRF